MVGFKLGDVYELYVRVSNKKSTADRSSDEGVNVMSVQLLMEIWDLCGDQLYTCCSARASWDPQTVRVALWMLNT